MKTIAKTLFFSAINVLLVSCSYGPSSATIAEDGNSKENRHQPDEISMTSKALMSDDYFGSFLIDENDQFQAVYSSQNYGTFYQIYCKPYIDNNNLDSLEFRIINYKGLLNIGFAENDFHKSECIYADGTLGVKLVVKGNSTRNTLTLDVRDKNFQKGDIDMLFIYRILLRLYEDKTMIENGVFDSEFFARSGLEDLPKELGPGLDGYFRDSVKGLNFDQFLEDEKLVKVGAGRNCYSSLNKVKWY